MSFEKEHDKWIKWHLDQRQGERKDALKRGHGYGNRMFAEKIWWSLMGQFNNLHPEYEVMDYGSHGKDRTKYRMDVTLSRFHWMN